MHHLRLGFWIPAVLLGAFMVLYAINLAPFWGNPIHASQCQELVRERLVSPSTARFEMESSRVQVRGTVYAANGFGTPVALDFSCAVDGGAVTLSYLD